MRYFGRTLHPEFTDLALVIGPNVRWVECDYEDLQRYRPEVLLGYSVRLLTAEDMLKGKHHGRRPEKVVLLSAEYDSREAWRLRDEIHYAVSSGYFPKVETWYVHRGRGIWQVS